MSVELNLCEILKGHEGESFYSPAFGNITFIGVDEDSADNYPLEFEDANGAIYLTIDGRYNLNAECTVFPSKEQRDWNKWLEDQKFPKTWSELQEKDISLNNIVRLIDSISNSYSWFDNKIRKSLIAHLKIYQIIEAGYGGNITEEEWKSTYPIYTIDYVPKSKVPFQICNYDVNPIAFRTRELAEEFLSYSENLELVKDFCLIK